MVKKRKIEWFKWAFYARKKNWFPFWWSWNIFCKDCDFWEKKKPPCTQIVT